MKHNASTKEQRSENDWRLLSRSEFLVGRLSGESTDHWLSEALEPFSVPPDLLNKLKQSLKEAVYRLITSSDGSHIVLRILISQDVKTHHSYNRNWGFFKLEKTGITSDEGVPSEHVIECYLYLEK